MHHSTIRTYRIVAGVIVLAISIAGIVQGSRAGIAQGLYWQAKFGSVKDYPRDVRLGATLRRCESAYRWYPYNYWFSIWTAETVWHERCDRLGREVPERVDGAALWCDRGLALNRHKSQLRLLKARLLERDSAARAMRYWEEYVEWQFWEPYNHAVLAELRAKAGDYAGAVAALEWVGGSRHYEQAARMVNEAWNRELQDAREKSESLPQAR